MPRSTKGWVVEGLLGRPRLDGFKSFSNGIKFRVRTNPEIPDALTNESRHVVSVKPKLLVSLYRPSCMTCRLEGEVRYVC